MSWFSRLFSPPQPSRREMSAQQNQLDGLEERVEYVYAELKKLRGRVYSNERQAKSLEDAPGETIGDGADTPEGARAASFGRHAPASTAHLAKRFRGF